jgi:hypothetical protein
VLLRGHHTRRRSSAALPIALIVSGNWYKRLRSGRSLFRREAVASRKGRGSSRWAQLDTTTNNGRANCRFAPISLPASAAMLAEPWGYARQNIAPLVLVEVWAARQRPPYLGGARLHLLKVVVCDVALKFLRQTKCPRPRRMTTQTNRRADCKKSVRAFRRVATMGVQSSLRRRHKRCRFCP